MVNIVNICEKRWEIYDNACFSYCAALKSKKSLITESDNVSGDELCFVKLAINYNFLSALPFYIFCSISVYFVNLINWSIFDGNCYRATLYLCVSY